MADEQLTALAERFCAWPLPPEVCVDSCATTKDHPYQRHGTNLLTVAQAKDMLRYVLECPACAGTGYADYAGFAMDPCAHTSEPVADHIGGEGDMNADIKQLDEFFNQGKGIDQAWQRLRRRLRAATPPNTNGDAVREALEKQMEDQDTDLPSSIQRQKGLTWLEGWFDIDAALATLAKHGGAEA